MRLLIAEDELDLAEALTVFFQKNHFSVDAVNDGADAYEYASSGFLKCNPLPPTTKRNWIYFCEYYLQSHSYNDCFPDTQINTI